MNSRSTLLAAHVDVMGKAVDLPLVVGTEQEVGIDIGLLRSETGAITLDPGFGNTGSCSSAITFIDGERGILRYRGYPIEELAKDATFLEVARLLLEGELPSEAELVAFDDEVRHHTMLHENFRRFFDALPMDAHPMPTCAAAIGALATFYQGAATREQQRVDVIRLLAKMPTIVATSYKHSIGQPPVYPRNDLDYASNFLHMMFSTPCEPYHVDPKMARALERLLILHADHEQNCSTSTVRLVGSSNANLYASIAAGISALWGPLHGGANQEVIEMLVRIDAEHGNADHFVARAKDRGDTARLMGFGHRVYKSYDPRAAILKQTCAEFRDTLQGRGSRLLDIAFRLEELALQDEYFVKRRLYPNVDFYSGILYMMMGVPVNMFTAMFALGRMPGWIAHWLEMKQDPATRIGRPRQVYVGPGERHYAPRASRSWRAPTIPWSSTASAIASR
jgi:citrate synthase